MHHSITQPHIPIIDSMKWWQMHRQVSVIVDTQAQTIIDDSTPKVTSNHHNLIQYKIDPNITTQNTIQYGDVAVNVCCVDVNLWISPHDASSSSFAFSTCIAQERTFIICMWSPNQLKIAKGKHIYCKDDYMHVTVYIIKGLQLADILLRETDNSSGGNVELWGSRRTMQQRNNTSTWPVALCSNGRRLTPRHHCIRNKIIVM